MARFKPGNTQRLTRDSLQLSAGWRLRDPAILTAVVIFLVIIGTVGTGLARQYLGTPAALAELREDNARVRDELQAARVELDVERATHTELQRHVVELQAQVGDLNQQLEFLSSRTAQAAGSRQRID